VSAAELATRGSFAIRYWGVRGSIATPGPGTLRYGGNTSCVEIRCGDQRFVLDAGTGIRGLGDQLLATGDPVRLTLLFSHLHWDHIQGLPFFLPAYQDSTELTIGCARREGVRLHDVLENQMTYPTSPVEFDEVCTATFNLLEFDAGETLTFGDVTVRTALLNHPGQATAYRFEYKGASFVHATDHEHGNEVIDAGLVALAQGADYLSYDSSYTEEEYAGVRGQAHIGWGHSTWEEAVKVAQRAEVRHLVLFHHDPAHNDDQMDAIHAQAKERFPQTVVAREGMEILLA
jgi:phosphoribosyl 1,2-cyclic phosphodiesterase